MRALFGSYLGIVAWIGLPILLGIALSRLGVPKGAARTCFRIAFYGCQTTVTVLAVWIARTSSNAAFLPVLALSGWVLSAGVGWLTSRRLGHAPRQRGAFIAVLCMSNNGITLLGFVALALFGEAGLAQAAYAQLLYTPFFLLFCFPMARYYGSGRDRVGLLRLLVGNVRDPQVFVPLFAMFVGLSLNAAHVSRPLLASALARYLIYIGTAISSVAVGLLFSGLHLARFWRENALSFLHRSTLYPLFYAGLAALLGLSALDTKILVLYGLVPSALLANLLGLFFDLDTELTSSVFLVSTTLFLLLVLPVYALAVVR